METTKEIKTAYLYELENQFIEIMNSTKRNQQHNFNLFVLGLKDLGYMGFSLKWFFSILRENNTEITISKRNKLNTFLKECEYLIPIRYSHEVIRKRFNEMNEHRVRGCFVVYQFI